ncbi:MAG: hypothetical protein JXA44_05150 [Methanospirillaceae archaeon]|nr:hypothetical protein [Methanospirillaceae archaeon]
MNVSLEVLDGLRELITIGVGHSAGMLNRLTRAHVTLTVPDVFISDEASLLYARSVFSGMTRGEISQVILRFTGALSGSFYLIIPHTSALNLVMILTGEEGSPDEMDALRIETLLEVGNIITGSVMSALSIVLTSRLSFQFPGYQTGPYDSVHPFTLPESDVGIIARTWFLLQKKEIEGDLFIHLTRESYAHLGICIRTAMEKGL